MKRWSVPRWTFPPGLASNWEVEPDLLRDIVQEMAEALMSADADAACNAAFGERSDQRTNRRTRYRSRRWDTRVGTIDLAIPKLRSGSYFPEWLLEPGGGQRRLSSRSSPTATSRGCPPAGSTCSCATSGSRASPSPEVSRLARELDAIAEAFRSPSPGRITLCLPVVGCPHPEGQRGKGGRIVSISVVKAGSQPRRVSGGPRM
jgi:putative transposase